MYFLNNIIHCRGLTELNMTAILVSERLIGIMGNDAHAHRFSASIVWI